MAITGLDVPSTRVVIIGGGIGGLTLGAILSRLNIPFVILERAPKITPCGAGISLSPNALHVLDQLGLYPAIQRDGQRLDKIRVYKENSLWRELNWLAEQTFGYPVYSIERHAFHRMLYAAAGGTRNVWLDAKVVDITDEKNRPYVEVTVADGRKVRGEVVVGADGIRSVTRRILARNEGMKEVNTVRFTGRVHMSGYTAPLRHLSDREVGVANWILCDDGLVTTWPCKDNRQWFIGVKDVNYPVGTEGNRSVWGHTTTDMIDEEHGHRFHPFGEDQTFHSIIKHSERVVASNVFQEVEFPRMSAGRVALLGDASHAMTSFFGQGAVQAVEDAAELANALNTYFTKTRGAAGPNYGALRAALERYSGPREARARDLVAFSANYAKLHTANFSVEVPLLGEVNLGPLMRRVAFGYVSDWAWMWCLRWLYGYQPVVEAIGEERCVVRKAGVQDGTGNLYPRQYAGAGGA